MTIEQMAIELDNLKKENATLKAKNGVKTGMKITTKGGLSVYGLGRFPVTLYKSQWLKLISLMDNIKTFIAANDTLLTDKK